MKKFPSFTEVSKLHTNNLEVINFMNRDAHKEILEAILSSGYYKEDGYTNFLIETVLINNYQDKVFEGTLENDILYAAVLEQLTISDVNEGKLKDWFDNKVETVKKWAEEGKEKAKEKGYQFIEKLKGFGDIVNLIVKSIQGFLKAAWDYFKKAATSSMGEFKDELVSKWKHWTESHEANVIDEVKSFGTMSKHAVSWATAGFPKDSASALQKAGNEEVEGGDGSEKKEAKHESYNFYDVMEKSLLISFAELIKEDSSIIDEIKEFNEWSNNPNETVLNELNEKLTSIINEDGHGHGSSDKTLEIPFLGKIAHKIGHLPPFKYLHNIESVVKEKTNNFFHKISIWLNKVAGGPAPFEYFYMGASLGLTAGALIKSGVTELVKAIGSAAIGVAIAAAVPGIGFILTILKYMAKGIWIVEVASVGITAASEVAAKKLKANKEDGSDHPAGSDEQGDSGKKEEDKQKEQH